MILWSRFQFSWAVLGCPWECLVRQAVCVLRQSETGLVMHLYVAMIPCDGRCVLWHKWLACFESLSVCRRFENDKWF